MSKPYAHCVPFKAEHLEVMELRPIEAELVSAYPAKYAALAQIGVGLTMMYDGRILGVLGYYQNWPGNYEVWVIPTIYVSKHPRVFLRTVRGKLDAMIETHAIHRLQSPAIADGFHDKWMTFLGFKEEGLLHQYSEAKEDFKMWSRVV